ncbi:MAG: GAF domain-containing protein [Cyanobacteriota bacterium]|nr:GAF domain-containing protein [Cyanobacteriota bacterium]
MSFTATPTSSQNSENSPAGVLLARGLTEKSGNYKKLISAALSWTGKEPFLTQMLCKLIVDAEDKPEEGNEAEWVDSLVRSQWLDCWETREELKSLRVIRDRLSQPKARSVKLLELYRQVLQKGEVPVTYSAEEKELQLLGLTAKQDGKLRVHNWIYASIFDIDWVEKTLKTLKATVESSDAEFLQTFAELERKLLISQVDILTQTEGDGEDGSVAQTLYEVLREVTAKVGDILGAERTTIFLLNDDKTELWSLVAQGENDEFLDIQVRVGEGIAGQVASSQQIIHIPENVYEDPRSQLVKEFDKKYNYRTHNILAFPILDDDAQLVAVIQLLNKVQQPGTSVRGFTATDIERLAKCVVPIRRILAICQSAYEATKKLRATAALTEATRSLDKLDLEDATQLLQRIMETAKKLMNADRSTLWLVDSDRGDLWTELPQQGVIRCPIGTGFAGQVALKRKPTIIPYDLYDDPNAENAKKTDEQTHYRTCSLLCMPVFGPNGDLLGVTQLVNKRKRGDLSEYDPNLWPEVPDYFKASFDKNDRQSMQVFNERVGTILNYVRANQSLKQRVQNEPKDTIYQALTLLTQAMTVQPQETGYDSLYHLLDFVGVSISKYIDCESAAAFLFERATQKLWSLAVDPRGRKVKEIRISSKKGIAARVLADRSVKINNKIGHFKHSLLSAEFKTTNTEALHHILLFPIFDGEGTPVAVIRLINKLKGPMVPGAAIAEQIDPHGFSRSDAKLLVRRRDALLPILLAGQSFYEEVRKQQPFCNLP